MILQLIAKDFKAHYATIFLKILLLWLSFGALMMFRLFEWDAYMMHALMAIAFACSVFLMKERNRNTDILTCSLPVTKKMVVIARYTTCGLIALAGIAIWFGIAHAANFFYSTSVTRIEQIINMKVVFMALFFLSLHISFFLPAVFRFRLGGVIIFFSLALIIALFSTAVIFNPGSYSFNNNVIFSKAVSIFGLSTILIVAPMFSVMFSIFLYNRTDL